MKYTKLQGVQGNWLKAKDVANGTLAKLVSETEPIQSVFEGKPRTQNVAQIKIKGNENQFNVALNKTTINALIDAFGEDSKDWVGKTLTIITEKTTIGGKRVTVMYLCPEGFELGEDDAGYVVISPKGLTKEKKEDEVDIGDIEDEDF